MAAPEGNRFWEARATHGRKKKYLSADDLWKQCCEYFEWVEDNPLWEAETVKFQGESKLTQVPKMRAMTIAGLCLFLDISEDTWARYRDDKDLSGVVSRAEQIIYTQKFSGAAADLLNPNIIARDLGLRESTKHEHSGHLSYSELTDEELDRYIAERKQALEQMQES